MYLCRTTANMSFPQIGKDFGKKDHTTVIHGYKRVKEDLLKDPEYANRINNIKVKISPQN